MKIKICLLSVILVVFSCTQDSDDLRCYGLNNFQCALYPWEENLKPDHTNDDKIKEMKSYFGDKGITIISAKYNPNFHEAVCLACAVCPRGDRYEIQVESKNSNTLEALKLAGSSVLDCSN